MFSLHFYKQNSTFLVIHFLRCTEIFIQLNSWSSSTRLKYSYAFWHVCTYIISKVFVGACQEGSRFMFTLANNLNKLARQLLWCGSELLIKFRLWNHTLTSWLCKQKEGLESSSQVRNHDHQIQSLRDIDLKIISFVFRQWKHQIKWLVTTAYGKD